MRRVAALVLVAFLGGCLNTTSVKRVDYSVVVARVDACSQRCDDEFLEPATLAPCYKKCAGAESYAGKACNEVYATTPCATVWTREEASEVNGIFYAVVFTAVGIVTTWFMWQELKKGLA